MSRCTVCRLEADRLNAIDAALRGGQMSLGEISSKTGITRSSLHRHRAHLPVAPDLVAIHQDRLTPIFSPPVIAEPSAAQPTGKFETHPQTATKAELLDRLEYLWQESLAGLEASKEPIRVLKPTGEVVEIRGDLRSRAGFIREGRSVLEMQGTVNGNLTVGSAGSAILIVLPVTSETSLSAPVIDIGLPARSDR